MVTPVSIHFKIIVVIFFWSCIYNLPCYVHYKHKYHKTHKFVLTCHIVHDSKNHLWLKVYHTKHVTYVPSHYSYKLDYVAVSFPILCVLFCQPYWKLSCSILIVFVWRIACPVLCRVCLKWKGMGGEKRGDLVYSGHLPLSPHLPPFKHRIIRD